VTEEESGHTPGTRERAPGVACNALDGPQDEPGGRSCRTRLCKATAGHPLH
jgi:hypothetical protein